MKHFLMYFLLFVLLILANRIIRELAGCEDDGNLLVNSVMALIPTATFAACHSLWLRRKMKN